MKRIILFLMLNVFVLGANELCPKVIETTSNGFRSNIITLKKDRSTTITFRVLRNNGKYFLEFVAFRLNKYVDENVTLVLKFDDESLDIYPNIAYANNSGKTRFEVPIGLGSNLTEKQLIGVELKYDGGLYSEVSSVKSIMIREIMKCIWTTK